MAAEAALVVCSVIDEIDLGDNGVLPVDGDSYRLKNCLTAGVTLRSEVRSPKALTDRRSDGVLICQWVG